MARASIGICKDIPLTIFVMLENILTNMLPEPESVPVAGEMKGVIKEWNYFKCKKFQSTNP